MKHNTKVEFLGHCEMADDPLMSKKERTDMVTHDVWKVSGYRFTYVSQSQAKDQAHDICAQGQGSSAHKEWVGRSQQAIWWTWESWTHCWEAIERLRRGSSSTSE